MEDGQDVYYLQYLYPDSQDSKHRMSLKFSDILINREWINEWINTYVKINELIWNLHEAKDFEIIHEQ